MNLMSLIYKLKKAKYFRHPTSTIGNHTKIWNNSVIREKVQIGNNCIIGRNVYVGPEVLIGNFVKIQDHSLIYDPAVISNGVFIGPGVIMTNDKFPRAVTRDFALKKTGDWSKSGIQVGEGASIGAGAICVAPIKIGEWAMIGAGSVVTKDVPNYAVVVGNPAKFIGWIGKEGVKLKQVALNKFICPISQREYLLVSTNEIVELNLP